MSRHARLGPALVASCVFIVACGARSGLIEPDVRADDDAVAEASDDNGDTTMNAERETGIDAGDVGIDAPAIDVVDVPSEPPPPVCVDGSVQFIYVVSQENQLFSYYPPSGAFTPIGTIACPVSADASPIPTPYSMSVDRGGTAYVVFSDGHLYRVSTATARCEATSFVVGQHGFTTFGMGFTADLHDTGETLYVAEGDFMGPSMGLAAIDTATLALNYIGEFSRTLGRTELTGTGDGRLFGFSVAIAPGGESTLAQIDPTDASVLRLTPLAVGDMEDAFAFAFWNEDFYIFTSPTGTTTVSRYRPADGSLVSVGTMSDTIVGAGVSTCAPH